MDKLTKLAIVSIVVLILLYIIDIRTVLVTNEHVIQITYFDSHNTHTEFAKSITYRKDNCITYIDLLGRENTICSQNLQITNIK